MQFSQGGMVLTRGSFDSERLTAHPANLRGSTGKEARKVLPDHGTTAVGQPVDILVMAPQKPLLPAGIRATLKW